jgi:hypothetical protein
MKDDQYPAGTVAWTGGDYAYNAQDILLARRLYRWHLTTYRKFWGDRPHPEIRDRFKSWARSDAYATRRENSC